MMVCLSNMLPFLEVILECCESNHLVPILGSVNALAFSEDGSHLISAADDGTIAVVRTGSWFVEKKWAGTHSGAGNYFPLFSYPVVFSMSLQSLCSGELICSCYWTLHPS